MASGKKVEIGQVWQRREHRESAYHGCFFVEGPSPYSRQDFMLVPCHVDPESGQWVYGAKHKSGRSVRSTIKWPGGIQQDMVFIEAGVTLVYPAEK
jgi:hypothetical protein